MWWYPSGTGMYLIEFLWLSYSPVSVSACVSSMQRYYQQWKSFLFSTFRKFLQDVVIVCDVCGTENVNPERDEDGDLVCEDCGEILPVSTNNIRWGPIKLEVEDKPRISIADGYRFPHFRNLSTVQVVVTRISTQRGIGMVTIFVKNVKKFFRTLAR